MSVPQSRASNVTAGAAFGFGVNIDAIDQGTDEVEGFGLARSPGQFYTSSERSRLATTMTGHWRVYASITLTIRNVFPSSAVHDDVVGPDMGRPARPQSDA